MTRSRGLSGADEIGTLADLLDAWRDDLYDRRARAIEIIADMRENGYAEVDVESLLFRELVALAKRALPHLLDLTEIVDL